jgi:hypothetical protein
MHATSTIPLVRIYWERFLLDSPWIQGHHDVWYTIITSTIFIQIQTSCPIHLHDSDDSFRDVIHAMMFSQLLEAAVSYLHLVTRSPIGVTGRFTRRPPPRLPRSNWLGNCAVPWVFSLGFSLATSIESRKWMGCVAVSWRFPEVVLLLRLA